VTVHHPGWGDLTYVVGFGVAAIVYLLTYRLPGLWRRAESAGPASTVNAAVSGNAGTASSAVSSTAGAGDER